MDAARRPVQVQHVQNLLVTASFLAIVINESNPKFLILKVFQVFFLLIILRLPTEVTRCVAFFSMITLMAFRTTRPSSSMCLFPSNFATVFMRSVTFFSMITLMTFSTQRPSSSVAFQEICTWKAFTFFCCFSF
eukprot:TRINITY_DN983_c0_g1_i4.p2 TRINITY_DN983_c0_g1~~TRINITY_DN983_c0_g1_i4.p2  ORF type:complete len:134 (-),score=24.19 TRINITY_DN983_c0_g1_i4:610-1011(-)